ncbi:M48 family metalloprotease [Streptomyces bottropensis]|uniref:hypothetical protein n=1 Tax=Streptomyces bottropensis TaxID=42235 RepID=UPI003675E48B
MFFRRRTAATADSAPSDDTCDLRDFVNGLGLPPVDNVRALVSFVEQYTGRPIKLIPVTDPAALPESLDAATPCGLWLATDTTDHIFYDGTTSLAHQDVIIGHELGHILRRHHTVDGDILAGVGTLGGILPDMTPALIRMLVGRTRYAEPDEVEAETIGSLLLEHVHASRSAHDDPISRTLLRRPR